MFNGVLWWTMLSSWSTLFPPCDYDVCSMEYCGETCFPIDHLRLTTLQSASHRTWPWWKKGLHSRNSPICTLSQNGYGTSFSNWNNVKHHNSRSSWARRREGQSENTSWWSVASPTSWRCAQPCYSILYCTTLHRCTDCPMVYFWSCSPLYAVSVMWLLLPWILTTVLG